MLSVTESLKGVDHTLFGIGNIKNFSNTADPSWAAILNGMLDQRGDTRTMIHQDNTQQAKILICVISPFIRLWSR